MPLSNQRGATVARFTFSCTSNPRFGKELGSFSGICLDVSLCRAAIIIIAIKDSIGSYYVYIPFEGYHKTGNLQHTIIL